MDDDLFAGASEEVVGEGSGERAERRREFINNITEGNVEKAGELRKVIQLSDNEAQLEELDRVLRAWRVLGRKVSNQTAKELVGEFCQRKAEPLGRGSPSPSVSTHVSDSP